MAGCYRQVDTRVRFPVLPAGLPPLGERPRAAGVLVRIMVDRELEALATVRQEDDGLRLRVLMRMVDRVHTAG